MVRGRIAGPETSDNKESMPVPLYEYTCQKCDATFDQLVRTADRDSKVKCPECGSTKTSRRPEPDRRRAANPKAPARPTRRPAADAARSGGCGTMAECRSLRSSEARQRTSFEPLQRLRLRSTSKTRKGGPSAGAALLVFILFQDDCRGV